ncbi:uncharacterized protein [Ptychodera flava]|uniref:uncharacterized protein n=1 Tax=Ptychodera flava TaxID=63121 RepID=UPI00396A0955
MRSSFVTVVFAIIGCIAMCRAQGDLMATAMSISAPDPLTGGFTADTATMTTFTVSFSLTGAHSPTDVKVYFSNADDSITSTEVTATGANAPDGTEVSSGGDYANLEASLTLDAANCEAYTKLCASIPVTDDDSTNNAVCIDFGADIAKAGTKTCIAEPDPQSSTVSDDAPGTSTQGIDDDDDDDDGCGGAGSLHLHVAVMLILLPATLLLLKI